MCRTLRLGDERRCSPPRRSVGQSSRFRHIFRGSSGHVRGQTPDMAPTSMAGVADTSDLEALLRDAFPEATEVRVTDRTGGGDHFQIEVTSPRFAGLSLVEQHRLVNDAL